jgi:hypothetical protein
MGKSKGKKKDPEKKAALQAKKEAKADRAALKRLKKEVEGESTRRQAADDGDEAPFPPTTDNLDDWLQHYRRLDQVDRVVIEDLEGFPPPRVNATLTLYEDSPKGKNRKELFLFGGEYFDGVSSAVVNHLLKVTIDSSSSNPGAARCSWKRICAPRAPPPRCAHSTVYYNHSLYVFGGEIAAGEAYHHYRDCWRFDLAQQEWTEIPCINKQASPSPRSGHTAVVWKHYMIIFGGFFESARSTSGKDGSNAAKWFHDVYVLDLQTNQWLDSILSHSKLAQRPDRRSAPNACVVKDDLIVHGGFSKLERKSDSSSSAPGGVVTVAPRSVAETKVHTDAWKLPLKPLIQQGKLGWERLTWSTTRQSWTATRGNPSGRSGCGSVGYKDRLLVFGGVVDAEQLHHKVDSVFYNDLAALDVEKKKWYPVAVRRSSPVVPVIVSSSPAGSGLVVGVSGGTEERKRDSDSVQERGKESKQDEQENNDDGESDGDLEGRGEESDQAPAADEEKGWDLSKLRSNMFAFLDGEGNVVYERLDEEEEKKVGYNSDEESESEETKEEDGDDRRHERPDRGAKSQVPGKPSPKTTKASSAMVLNPRTKLPEAVVRAEPIPRINARLVVAGHTLLVYGGLVEVGDREVTLDDFWRLELRKREGWECLFPGTMHKQKWRGAAHDDEDSYVSAGDGENRDDEEASSDEEQDEVAVVPKRAHENIDEDEDGVSGSDEVPSPLEGEPLTDFYKRTAAYWTLQASAAGDANDRDQSDKGLKREAFRLAQDRFSESKSVQERIRGLTLRSSLQE